jgi:hypothetical protein
MTEKYDPVRSVRIPDDLWEMAKTRAKRDGVDMSKMMYLFIQCYATGIIDLPVITITVTDSKPSLDVEVVR